MSLIARYKFDDLATLTTDDTGNGNTLTNINSVTTITDPTYGTVSSFVGNTDGYLSLPSAPAAIVGSSSRTFSFWVKFGDADIPRIVHGQGSAFEDEYRHQVRHGSYTIHRGSPSSFAISTPTDDWRHIAITYDGTTEVFYENDVAIHTTAISLNTVSGPLFIGSAPIAVSGNTLEGNLLDFRLYDGALSTGEITTLFSEGPNFVPRLFNQLQIESTNISMNFRELELYDLSGDNIVLGRNVDAGSAFGAGTAPNGNNGSLDDLVNMDLVGGIPTWTVDLDRGYYLSEISRVIFYNRTGSAVVTDRAIGSTVPLLSVDGGPPEVIATLTNVDIQEFFITVPVVDWVLDANNKYEVSSRNHLIQIMNDGAIFTNTGDVPTTWLASDYIQTVDIDLEGDSTNIKPIGTNSSTFTGEYDGNGFNISNWSYSDPNFATNSEENHVGLFGSISNATVKNIILDGVCTLTGWRVYAGMVVGFTTNSNIFNIGCNLSVGSYMTQDDAVSISGWTYVGTVIGNIQGGTTTAITFRGVMDSITLSSNVTNHLVAGVVSRVASGVHNLMRNLGTFPTGLNANHTVGGVVGEITGTANNLLNAMTGDLNAGNAGGVAGIMVVDAGSGEFVNSMKGNITSSSRYSGGIIAVLVQAAGSTMSSLMNYMGGNITNNFNGFSNDSGGIIGDGRNTNMNFATSINAMNGEVNNTVLGKDYAVTDLAFVDTSYGLTSTTDNYSTTTPITGLPTDPGTGLPIVDLSATDPDGVTHTFDFVFGNLPRLFNQLQIESTNISMNFRELELYDLSGDNIVLGRNVDAGSAFGAGTAPNGNNGSLDDLVNMDLVGGIPTWTVDLDRGYYLSEISRVIFYNRTGSAVVTDRAIGSTISLLSVDGGPPEVIATLTNVDIQEFVINELAFVATPRVTTVLFSVTLVDGATGYRLTSQRAGSTREVIAIRSFTDLNQTIRILVPETEYTFRLYSTTGTGFTLEGESIVNTLENSAGNYNVNDFVGPSGRFDISTLDTTSVGLISDVMNDLFTTDDAIDINISGRTRTSKFVNRGGTVDVTDSDALVAPFSTSGGSGQAISMTLSDASSVAVSYNETTEAVTIGPTTYDTGESLVLDGKKVTIVDI